MVFLLANVWPRGRGPSKHRSHLRTIEPCQNKFWTKWYAISSFSANGNINWRLGRNKLVINHLGKLFVTSDAATIIREIEVVHPAAKLLVMASQAQETEVSSKLSLCRAINVNP